jgi:DNA/RNA-binding domain of Phe-tRNA-synthetase-like protein
MPLEYCIDPAIFALDPGYRRGLIIAGSLANQPSPEALIAQLRGQELKLRGELGEVPVTEHPRIAAWRSIYRSFGARPSDFRSSIEALARRVARGDALPSINALVDIGTIVSLRYLTPVGVHPAPDGGAPLQLRLTVPGDTFLPPDGGPAESPAPGEVVFVQGTCVLTRRWTWRQAAGTLTHLDTTAVYFNIDALSVLPDAALKAASADVAALVQEFCGGVLESAVLDARNPRLGN